MTPAPLILLPDAYLSEPELRSATLDGELAQLGEGYVPADAPLTPMARAMSLAPLLVEPRILLSHRSAAWVWGWLPAQPGISTSVPIGARISSGRRRRLSTREVVIDEHEVHRWGDLGVTTRVRTLIDLARHDEGDDVTRIIARALRERPALRTEAATYLGSGARASHVRRARERVNAALQLSTVADAIDVVHGVDTSHGVEHAVEVCRVAHLEHEAAQGQTVARSVDARRQNVDVVL